MHLHTSVARSFFLASLFSLAIFSAGCGPSQSQIDFEHRVVKGLVLQSTMLALDHPELALTNMVQLFNDSVKGNWLYPHNAESTLRQYGLSAGFTNSIYEKYVMPSQEVRHPTETGTRIFFLNGQPFQDEQGEAGRIIAWRAGPGYTNYWSDWYPEAQVRKFFTDAGIAELPRPVPMPPAPPAPPSVQHKDSYPPSVHVQMLFQRFARAIGLPRSQWLNLLACCAVLLLMGVVLFFIWMSRRGKD